MFHQPTYLSWFVLFFNLQLRVTFGIPDCGQTYSGPSRFKPCSFPFTFEGVEYNECIDVQDPGKFWCSIHPNGTYGRAEGLWGYCHFRCYRAKVAATTTTTTVRPTSTLSDMLLRSAGQGSSSDDGSGITPTTITALEESDGGEEVGDKTALGNYLPLVTDSPVTCGYRTATGFIIGGSDTKRGEFPFIAALGYRETPSDPVKFYCGGTLINRRYVLTAAHCHHRSDPQKQIKQVVLGDHKLGQDPDCPGCAKNQVFEIGPEDVTVHPDWNQGRAVKDGNDIALIRLPRAATTIEQDPKVRVLPACVRWNRDISVAPQNDHFVVGWGRTNNDEADLGNQTTVGAFSTILQKLKVPVFSAQFCIKQYPLFRQIHKERHLCAGGEKGKDSCAGDSGGPLVARRAQDIQAPMYLRGIVSFGTRNCGLGLPGVYTKLDYYISWIKESLRP